MSDANRTQIAYVEESTIGTFPGTATMTKLRFTDESLNYNIEGITTNEIRSDRQPTDFIQTGRESSGGVNFELSFGAFDDMFEGALFSDWVGVGTGTTMTITAAAGNYNFTLNATANTIALGASVSHAILSGQWIELIGSTADDGYHFVTNVATNTLTVQSITTGEALSATTVMIKGMRLRNGTTEHGYSIERALEDKGDYFGFKGMRVNTMTITATASSILTGAFEFMGEEAIAATATMSGGAYAEAAAYDVMNAVSNVGEIMEGSSMAALTGQYIQELTFTVNNNLRGVPAIGYAYNVDVGAGSLEINGTMNLYYEDLTIYNKFVNSTTSGLSFKTEDPSGNAYIFTFPRVRYSGDTINASGKNTDVMENMTWAGLRHATHDYTVQICKFTA